MMRMVIKQTKIFYGWNNTCTLKAAFQAAFNVQVQKTIFSL